MQSSTLAHRRGPWAFVAGVIAVTACVLLHMPMFLMGRHNHFDSSGMAMGADMIAGMVLIVSGVAALAILALVPALQFVSLVLIVPTVAAVGLVAWFGKETRGRDLRDLDPDGQTFAATGM